MTSTQDPGPNTRAPRFDLPDWHSRHIPNWERWLAPYVGREGVYALEIGSCEGRSTLWLLDNVLRANFSGITCVDPFEENDFVEGRSTISATEARENFVRNTFGRGVLFMNVRSSAALRGMRFRLSIASGIPSLAPPFDIVYVDGSHKAKDVLEDAVLAWPLVKPGGTLIFDDYEWTAPSGELFDTPKPAIDTFLSFYAGEYELLEGVDGRKKGVQVAVRRR